MQTVEGHDLVKQLSKSISTEFTRKQKGDKKMKHKKRDPGSWVPSSKSNISRAMRGRIPKIPNFLARRSQRSGEATISHSEQPTTSSANTPAAAVQQTRTSDRNRRSPSYYGFESSPPDSTILPSPKRPRQAGDVESFQPPPDSIIESVQQISENQPEEPSVSPLIGQVSPSASRNPSLLE